MKAAIIDLGTNTFNLLIAEGDKTKQEIIFKNKIGVKLGAGGINSKRIMPDAFERGLNAIAEHKKTIEQHKVDNIFAFATSATRNAENGQDFVNQVKEKYGIEIHVIDGNREAGLIHKGVSMAVDIPDENVLLLDIGGGSNEFVFANQNQTFWMKSYDLGMARLLDRFKPGDPIVPQSIVDIELFLDTQLNDFFEQYLTYQPTLLIGSSGTFDTFASLDLAKKHKLDGYYESNTSYEIKIEDYTKIHNELVQSTREERLAMKGMEAIRVDMIVLATIFVNYIVKNTGITRIIQSDYAIKEGIMAEIFEN